MQIDSDTNLCLGQTDRFDRGQARLVKFIRIFSFLDFTKTIYFQKNTFPFRLCHFVLFGHIVVRILWIRLYLNSVFPFQMTSQVGYSRIVLRACRTSVTLLFARVHAHVFFQISANEKRSITHITFVRFVRGVYPFVYDQFPFRFKAFVAFVTVEVHLVRMVGMMRLQIFFEFERFGANVTFEWT